ncbi:MAG: hypothetical protein R3246_10220 [Acidimicrobiia bacterium]|nr:hypothetical protein [Acidimicrobiia bacterium]
MAEYSVQSAYDPSSNLRLLRIAGDDISDAILLGLGRADPTASLIPTAKNLVDIREWRYQGSVLEVESQAELLSQLFEQGMGVGYAWVTNPTIHGLTLVFRRHLRRRGIGDPQPFTTLDGALNHLDVTMADYLRTEAALETIPPVG